MPPDKGIGMNGQAFAFHYALPVDSAGELPDGRPFKDMREFKRLLVQDEVPIARNLARQLTVLRHGRAGAVLRPRGDREDRSSAGERQYGVRSLVHGIVQSELFETSDR